MSLSIVVPNYNGQDLIRSYLPSVLTSAEKAGASRIIVVDDASADQSEQAVRSVSGDIEYVQRDANGGFGEAVNTGAALVETDYMAIIMTDLDLEPDCLAVALEEAEDPTVFAVGFQMKRDEASGNESITGLPFRRGFFHTTFPDGDKPGAYTGDLSEVAFVLGGAAVLRKRVFDDLGGFDPAYAPFFWEDIDLCWRAWRRGLRSVCAGRALAWHRHPHKTVDATAKRADIERIVWRNRILFVRKNISSPRYLLEHRMWLTWMLAKRRAMGDDLLRSAVREAGARNHLLRRNPTGDRVGEHDLIRKIAEPRIVRPASKHAAAVY